MKIVVIFGLPVSSDKIKMFQVELSLAYGCEDSLSRKTLLQYVHVNRAHNGRRLDNIGH